MNDQCIYCGHLMQSHAGMVGCVTRSDGHLEAQEVYRTALEATTIGGRPNYLAAWRVLNLAAARAAADVQIEQGIKES